MIYEQEEQSGVSWPIDGKLLKNHFTIMEYALGFAAGARGKYDQAWVIQLGEYRYQWVCGRGFESPVLPAIGLVDLDYRNGPGHLHGRSA